MSQNDRRTSDMLSRLIIVFVLVVMPSTVLVAQVSNCNLLPENCLDRCETLQGCIGNGEPCGEEITRFAQCLHPEVMVLMGHRTTSRLVLDVSQTAEQLQQIAFGIVSRSNEELEAQGHADDYFVRVGRCVGAGGPETGDVHSMPWVIAVLRDRGQAALRYHGFPNAACSGEAPVVSAFDPMHFSSSVRSYIDTGSSPNTQNSAPSKISPIAKSDSVDAR